MQLYLQLVLFFVSVHRVLKSDNQNSHSDTLVRIKYPCDCCGVSKF